MSQRSRSRGYVRELRARGVTFDVSGRARVGGKFISDRSLTTRLAYLRRPQGTVDQKLARWGLDVSGRARATPELVARAAEVSERTAKKWIERGGIPDAAADRVASEITRARAYDSTWKHGRNAKATRGEERALREAFRKFVRSRERGDPKAHEKYEKWRRVKDFVRGRLTEKGWRALMARLGRREGLAQFGMFSVMRFILS